MTGLRGAMTLYMLTFTKRAFFFFQAEDGIRDDLVTGVQTCALPILSVLRRKGVHNRASHGTRSYVLSAPLLQGVPMIAAAICALGTASRNWVSPQLRGFAKITVLRSEERRVGKECRSRWSPYH